MVAELKTTTDPQSPHPSPLPGGEGGIPGSPLSLLGLLPLGFVRRNGAATGTVHTDYLTAIQPTLTNGSFATGLAQWESTGAVSAAVAAHYTVTLSESSPTSAGQTHAGQAFLLGTTDRFLSFTVSGLNLQSNSDAQDAAYNTAQDAFEVALLNANTGVSLLGGLGAPPRKSAIPTTPTAAAPM